MDIIEAFDNEVAKRLSPEEYEKYLKLILGEITEEDKRWAHKIIDKREAESHDITKSSFGYE